MSTENQILIIVTLIIVLVVALAINYAIYKRQVAAQQRRIQIKKIQGMLPDLLDCLSALKQTQCSPSITQLLESFASELLDEISKLTNDTAFLDKLQNSRLPIETPNQDTVSEAKQVKQAINKTMTVLRMLEHQKKITPQQTEQLSTELKLTQLICDAEGLLRLSEGAIAENKISPAKSHLRNAKNILSKIPESDPRKEQLQNKTEALLKSTEPSTQDSPAPAPEAT